MENGELDIWNMVGLSPDIEEPLCDKAEHPLVIVAVVGDVQPLFQLEENIEQPVAIGVQRLPAHHEHVEAVAFFALQRGVKSRYIVGVTLFQDRFRHDQIVHVMSMGILVVPGFDQVIPFLWENDRILVQQFPCFLGVENTGPLVPMSCCVLAGKVPAVVAEPNGVGIQVFPGPVEPRHLAEASVLLADVVSRVVPGIGKRLVEHGADMERQIQRIRRHLILFVCGDDNLNVQV